MQILISFFMKMAKKVLPDVTAYNIDTLFAVSPAKSVEAQKQCSEHCSLATVFHRGEGGKQPVAE